MKKNKKKKTDALEILNADIKKNSLASQALERSRINVEVAQLIYDARVKSKLTQQELANRIGSTQPVISKLEDGDYDGHSLFMLQRIASALKMHLAISLESIEEDKLAA
jgi:ribosome-binding protein aMBF1 (putative translation factor)